ncbi:MAG: MAPEG family protein [bacterium]
MPPLSLLLPVFVLVFLTIGAAFWLLKCRYRAVTEGLNPLYFKTNRGAKIPAYLEQATQHYDNLYEMPTLFYAVVAITLAVGATDVTMVILAWVYTGSRVVHSWIHLGSNRILRRRNIFLVSVFVLASMWLWLLIRLVFQ